ncbi:hypothetical protein MBLNU230_g5814t1 [Neophaeotheca triangularis]
MLKYITLLAALTATLGSFTIAEDVTAPIEEGGKVETFRHFECGTSARDASASFNDTVRRIRMLKSKHNARPDVVSLNETALLEHGDAHLGTRSPRFFLKQNKVIPHSIVVPTYFHIITTTAKANTITQETIDAQLAVLNTAYRTTGVSFNLLGTDYTVNDAWATASGATLSQAKSALRKGTYGTLNLYFHTDLGGAILGTCSLPAQTWPSTPQAAYASDGCTINAGTMPSGGIRGYNRGMTAVHETGHWLGLLHTFEGYSCSGAGDNIDDTPMQSTSTDGCPSKPSKNSCPAVPGVDAIHNYMDYSTDACYNNFTPGQAARIQSMWTAYRKDK